MTVWREERRTDAKLSRSIRVLVPSGVRRQLAEGTARVSLMSPDGSSLQLRGDGGPEPVPEGLYRVALVAKFGRAISGSVDLTGNQDAVVRFRPEAITRRPISGLALVGGAPGTDRASGVFWLRLVEGPSRRPVTRNCKAFVASTGRITLRIEGPPPAHPGVDIQGNALGRAFLRLDMRPADGSRDSVAFLDWAATGSTVTLSAVPWNPGMVQQTRLLKEVHNDAAIEQLLSLMEEASNRIHVNDLALISNAILRTGDAVRLSRAASGITARDDITSDILIIVAEWYASAGCHVSAMNVLGELPKYGLPLLSGCYSMALSRLSSYSAAKGDASTSQSGFQTGNLPSRSFAMAVSAAQEIGGDDVPLVRGQRLEQWNIEEAARLHQHLTRGIDSVDWADPLLKISLNQSGRTRQLQQVVSQWLGRGWMPVRWKFKGEDSEKGSVPDEWTKSG